ncbi:hypothetical protein DMN91_003735 [Ooceraea biroi]|uniref:Lamin-B receptor n=1 Tax=Ooceraea biroi TaxID=2015173 RepID=A0A026VWA1_OOCBI|nr:delta(14)-sterol reductase [Ooceraea biroi]XP_011349179.1 delta(14)-sterol reductase [Ooceraea biroi]EZA47791.1 Lamin-B receptor [Ooceraea biroi]RLU23530.1 hypothetical protein DMN91_003735 [Ooceraea biroi]
MKYTEGEQVLAKHPALLEYHRGTILNIRGDRYKIKFDTGGEHTVSEDDIQHHRASRSTTRTSSRAPKKSPSKYSPSRKSPSRRSPSRRSPSRRSPSRRSPGRSPTTTTTSSRKLPVRNTRFAKISLPRIDYEGESNHKDEISAEEEKSIETIPLQQRLNAESTRRYRTKQFSNVKSEQEYRMGQFMRSIDRAVSLPLERKTYVHDYLPEEKERGYSVQRDQDLKQTFPSQESEKREEVAKREKEISNVGKPQEWGGWIGTSLLTLILPLSLILPQLLCSRERCGFASIKLSADLKSYINLHGLLSYILLLTLLAFISIVPIGRVVDGQQSKIGRLRYRVNGLLSALVATAAFVLCVYKNIQVDDYILSNIVQLSIGGWILGTISALGLYIKAERAPIANLNIYASTNSRIYNFWQGKEISPRIGTLDIKLLLIRTSFVGTLIVHMAILAKAFNGIGSLSVEQLNWTTILLVTLQLWYIVHGLINEAAILTSFEIMYEGTGYMTCVSRLLYPFLATLATRFTLYQRMEFNWYSAGICTASFLAGYVLYAISNLRKNAFRRNPVTPASWSETISTLRGKRLMLSGLWGYVRHPNYLGDIVIHWSFAGISLAGDILPFYAAIWLTLVLAYRAVRDNRRCQARYGYAWEQYCSRVKYMLLKHVF